MNYRFPKNMKKLNFLYLFCILFSFSFSQEFSNKLKNARMGLYVAPAINFIQTDSKDIETNSKPGVVYGYALEVALNEFHRLESGFGITYKGGVLSQNQIIDYKVQYLTVPIFIKMRSREIGYFNYFARIGPSINLKIKEMISPNTLNKTTNPGLIDISIFIGMEYSLGGKTSVEGSVFFNNNITNALGDNNDPDALFHQIGLRFGFLF